MAQQSGQWKLEQLGRYRILARTVLKSCSGVLEGLNACPCPPCPSHQALWCQKRAVCDRLFRSNHLSKQITRTQQLAASMNFNDMFIVSRRICFRFALATLVQTWPIVQKALEQLEAQSREGPLDFMWRAPFWPLLINQESWLIQGHRCAKQP